MAITNKPLKHAVGALEERADLHEVIRLVAQHRGEHHAAPEVRAAFARFGRHVGMAHALRTEAEDGVNYGIDDAGVRAACELEAARAAIAVLDAVGLLFYVIPGLIAFGVDFGPSIAFSSSVNPTNPRIASM